MPHTTSLGNSHSHSHSCSHNYTATQLPAAFCTLATTHLLQPAAVWSCTDRSDHHVGNVMLPGQCVAAAAPVARAGALSPQLPCVESTGPELCPGSLGVPGRLHPPTAPPLGSLAAPAMPTTYPRGIQSLGKNNGSIQRHCQGFAAISPSPVNPRPL